MPQIIDGKQIAMQIKEELKERVARLKQAGKSVCLAVIQVGNDPASTVYVNGKKKDCAYIGIESRSYELPEETKEEELLALLDQLNHTEDVHGILVQLPLPSHMDESKVVKAIDPAKDVDGFIRSISGSFVSEGMALTAVRQLESFNF
jgi:methylenetetrahydrofolate dehydrogenase (NADP+)/methenyltetrahydrofolate cyclohydrolase